MKNDSKENQSIQYEQFLGIESEKIVYNNRYNDDYYRYEPTSYSGLICAFDALEGEITGNDRLVDFGCGKGRVLFYFNQRFSCDVCGIEVDEEVYESALDNRAYYDTRFRGNAAQIELICGRAEDYEVRPEDSIFYFFNPFELVVFGQVIENIMNSVKEHPRRIFVILYYPKEDYRIYLRHKRFSLHKLVKLPEYEYDLDEKVVIYSYGMPVPEEEFDIYK